MEKRRPIKYEPSFEFEHAYPSPVVGLDEAGCGAWVGPVVAGAAFILPACPHDLLHALNDSKRLTEKVRESLFQTFQENPAYIKIATGLATTEEIESLNIRNAALLAMSRAYELLEIPALMALVDGTGKPRLPCPSRSIIKGDQRSYSIAAASIAAKVTRDHLMKALAEEFPSYGWATNAGYGTQEHQRALKEHGVTPYHRRSYKPIQALLGTLFSSL
ncbi:MAG: ribonuclease HII [Alphaproteobacteria bacterium]